MKKYLLITLLLTIIVLNANSQDWTQIGNDLMGAAENDLYGLETTINADGSVVAISSTRNDIAGQNAGIVRVYQNIEGTWTQMGTDLFGENEGDEFGSAISLSADGQRLAVGAANYGDNYQGQVKILEYNGTSWEQVGNAIDGLSDNNFCGYNLSLNTAGNTIAVSYPYITDAGQVKIFSYNGTSWEQVGNTIDGENDGDNIGELSINADGSIVAIGATYNDDAGSNAGQIRVFKNISGTWTQQGSDIDGEAENDFFGRVSISNDGLTVAGGAFGNDEFADGAGNVRIFNFDGTNWTQVGSDIYGEAEGDWAGTPSLSGDATKVAIGAFRNINDGGDWAGQIRVFEFDGTDWTQIGNDIDGVAENDGFGQSLALSNDGTTVIGGSPRNDDFANDAGNARVFSNTMIATQPTDQLDFCIGENANFSITGNGVTSYQWQVSTDNGQNWSDIADDATYTGTATFSLTVTTDLSLNNNQYHCIVSNGTENETSRMALLTVLPNTEITTQPISQENMTLGEDITFSIEAEGGNLTYRWRKNEIELVDGGNVTGSATNELTLTNVFAANAGNYDCVVTGSCGEETSDEAILSFEPNSISNINSEINIYPNPTTGIINLTGSQNLSGLNLQITDITGKTIYTTMGHGPLQIDISNQPAGIYFIKIQTEHEIIIKKIIKN